MIYVKSLEKLTDNDLSAAGSKAVALARIVKKGIFTPPGFVVLSPAFERFCRVSKINTAIEKLLEVSAIKNSRELAKRSDEIKSLIASKHLSNDITAQIEEAYDTLNSARVAVRSSPALEDEAISGRMDSYIGVDLANLAECVKNCWSSVFSEQSLVGLLKAGVDPRKIKMAVLVQRMVDCEVSGPAFFKIDSVTGKRCLVIATGQGAAGGAALPDYYELNIDPLYIRGKKIAKLAKQKLSDDQIRWLAQVVLKIEGIFASPRGVEWGFSNGRIVILRCSAAVKNANQGAKEQVWSNVNIAEVLPGVVFPLVSSVMVAMIDPAFRFILAVSKDEPLIRVINGRLYFNATTVARSLSKTTKIKEFPITDFFGGQAGAKNLKLNFSSNFGVIFYGAKVLFYSIISGRGFEEKIAQAKKASREFERRVGKADGLEDLFALELEISVYLRQVALRAFSTLLFPLSFYFVFTELCKKWLIDKTGEKANSFLAGGSRRIAMLQAFDELWVLSRGIKNDRDLSHKFLRTQTVAKAEAALGESRQAGAGWNNFLDKFGDRCAKEVDFSIPRWREDPTFLINTIKMYMGASEEISPASKMEKLANRKEMLLWETKRLMPGWKFAIFARILGLAESAQFVRERAKAVLISLLFPLRMVYLKIGLKLSEGGNLREAFDIFYLTSDEIGALRLGLLQKDSGLAELVARRKSEFKRFTGLRMPAIITGDKEVWPMADATISANKNGAGVLQGLGVSSGIAQGVARVVNDIDEIWKIRPGEILVCDHLDPGWTPVFVVVKGVVTNTGGLLSHASIVAREYGLPAVVNVADATEKILDGQKIIVDGNRGTVKIVEESGNG